MMVSTYDRPASTCRSLNNTYFVVVVVCAPLCHEEVHGDLLLMRLLLKLNVRTSLRRKPTSLLSTLNDDTSLSTVEDYIERTSAWC